MTAKVSALTWRPQTFSDLIGQDAVSKTLQNAIRTERLHHAFLFSGLRGSGKTSTARILAKALNCVQGPTPEPCLVCPSCIEIREGRAIDVLEIDAASNNSVDNIRDLRETVRYRPTRDRYKIYIIDEVHMLSTSAFNALLKTLEEPPSHVVFIMATTELHKIPATILSRSQQFDFRQIPLNLIEAHLQKIAQSEQLNIESDVFPLISQACGGSVRDALSIFDQVIAASGDEITALDAETILGVVKEQHLLDLIGAVIDRNAERVFLRIQELIQSGHDLKVVYEALTSFVRDLIVLISTPNASDLTIRRFGDPLAYQSLLQRTSARELIRFLNVLISQEPLFRQASIPQFALELILLKMIELKQLTSVEAILEQLNNQPDFEKKNS
jgi:DNA polymerase-3 subunit gamma/tau